MKREEVFSSLDVQTLGAGINFIPLSTNAYLFVQPETECEIK